MTREEAFKFARNDWKQEEATYKEQGMCQYGFDTDTIKWIENLREAATLAYRIRDRLESLRDELTGDEKVLGHYCTPYSCMKGEMITKDLEGAKRLVNALTTFASKLESILYKEAKNEGDR